MELEIVVLQEKPRGCGYRKSGEDGVGLYLMGDGALESCERLPFPLSVCPCCGGGIKFSRGFTWINPAQMLDGDPRCQPESMAHYHLGCYVCNPPNEPHGLMWVGEKFYTPEEFIREANERGISKRVPAVPRGFEFGKHLVYMAHKKAVPGEKPAPGLFFAYKPSWLDIVVDTTDPAQLPERARHLAEKYGEAARLVKVERDEDQREMFNQ